MTVSYCLGAALSRLSALPRDQHDAEIARLPDACAHAGCTTGMGCRAYVSSLVGSEFERRRRSSEARNWLRRGFTNNVKVNPLIEIIATRRGRAAAEVLRQDMRDQWARRRDWLGVFK